MPELQNQKESTPMPVASQPDSPLELPDHPRAVAIIGMACRFPGARTVEEFRRNLEQGVESIRTFTDTELLQAGVAADQLADPHYVKAAPVLDEFDHFDAEFFQYAGRDAELMDPQHRLFLECAWEALENGGYAADPSQAECRSIGVFGGAGSLMGSYLLSESHVNESLISPLPAAATSATTRTISARASPTNSIWVGLQ